MARHPNIFGGLETHWFTPEMLDGWRDATAQRQVWLRAFFDVSDAEYSQLQATSDSGLEFFDRFMSYCAKRAGKPRWVEKTPDNILHLDLIRRTWPDAQVLHVIRDHRDVYASWKKNQTGSLEAFFAKAASHRRAVGDLAETRSANYLEVAYERLVVESRKVLSEVFEFLGEPWSEDVAAYEGDDSDYRRVLEVTGKESPTTKSLSRPIFSSSVGQWKQVLTPEEAQSIQDNLRSG